MITHALLTEASHHGERVASRRLAAREGISDEEALRTILEAAAPDGLAALIEARAALRQAAANKRAMRTEAQATALALKMRRHAGPPSPWTAWFDGSAHPNPGRCGIGGIVTGPHGQRRELSRPAGHGNSSEAEYLALIAVLEEAHAAGADELTVYGDSRGVIDDASGPALSGAPSLAQLRARAQSLMASIGKVSLRWVPRHKNPDADALSQRAIAAQNLSEIAAPPPHPDA